ncbi:MAG: hypothetical protein JOZ80_11260 [Acidobacteriaceae bacterium]|nr:hypothetical protein [Acidobacteriaceae bacterium]
MKKPILLASVTVVFIFSFAAAAQDVSRSPKLSAGHTAKVIRVAGRLSNDGKTLSDERDHRVWKIANSDLLTGYEGQELMLRGRAGTEANWFEVMSVKAQRTYTANWGDSAFRR